MGLANFLGSWFSVAVEFAGNLVDSPDPNARLAGLLVTAAVALLMLLLVVRRRWRPSSPGKALAAALELGGKMLGFHHMRASVAPPEPLPFWRRYFPWPGREQWSPSYGDRSVHDAETMTLWARLYAKELSVVLAKLHEEDLVDQAEMTRLLAPQTPAEVEILARRLIELGCLGKGLSPEVWAVES
jgi:hypothetical protein